MDPWPHQLRAINAVVGAHKQGRRRVVLTSPTGGGKTFIVQKLIELWRTIGRQVSVYSNRRLLVEQLRRNLAGAGFEVGVRAAGYPDERHLPIQISSVQTEDRRVISRKEKDDPRAWDIHPADLVVFDEGHLMTRGAAVELAGLHLEAVKDCLVLYVTATPLGMGEVADVLIQAGTPSELRACGALVPAVHYGPDEPDLRKVKMVEGEDPSENELRKAISPVHLFGSVFENWKRLNPEAKPTLLFAPGVAESRWFAQEFVRRGVTAAHIDGESVWMNGEELAASRESREEVLRGSEHGRVGVVCNRFVLREGIDAPWLAHGILATVFGSLQSYLQAGGRLLRSHRSLREVTVQDHGGNWWRHGSLNDDRHWDLELTDRVAVQLRADRLRRRDDEEPWRCGECGRVCRGPSCPCGWEARERRVTRKVLQADGRLMELSGRIFKARSGPDRPDVRKHWARCYWRARNADMTFKQAVGLFVSEKHVWPPETLPLMPLNEMDWYRKVKDVDMGRLRK